METSKLNNNCSNHRKDILGISDMKELAKMITDLHYESLAELLDHVSVNLDLDGQKDYEAGRKELGSALQNAATYMYDAKGLISKAWEISKPFMEEKSK